MNSTLLTVRFVCSSYPTCEYDRDKNGTRAEINQDQFPVTVHRNSAAFARLGLVPQVYNTGCIVYYIPITLFIEMERARLSSKGL